MTELHRLSATGLRSMLRDRKISAEELMRATLDRIAKVNPGVNAIVGLDDPDRLIAQARAADGAADQGPLHGLPIAVKDLVNVKGLRSTFGSPALADFVPGADDLIAARMRAAGAILIGKTNTPEWGLGSHTFNPVYGATRNPYDPSRSAGGSSGGAAVALATGMIPLADGSDMMGSLRNPAGWCNVYGFRPSWGWVPADPVGEMFLHQLATLGPMARNPADLGLLLDVISGRDPRQPHGGEGAPVGAIEPMDLTGLRLGWLGDWGGAFPCEEGVLATCESALATFAEMGAVVEPLAPPFDAGAMWRSWVELRAWAVAGKLGPLMDQGWPMKDSAEWEIATGRALSAMDVNAASMIRSDWFRAAVQALETYDALLLPTAQVWPFDVTLSYPADVAGHAADTYHRWMQVVVPASLIGLPTLAVPAGFGENGLPMGLQIIGPRRSDKRLLQIGAAWHEATRWPDRRPPEG